MVYYDIPDAYTSREMGIYDHGTPYFQTTLLSLTFISVPSHLGWKTLVMEVRAGMEVEDRTVKDGMEVEDRAGMGD